MARSSSKKSSYGKKPRSSKKRARKTNAYEPAPGRRDANWLVADVGTGSSHIVHVNVIPQGSADNQRTNRKIYLKSLQLRGVMEASGNNAPPGSGPSDGWSRPTSLVIIYDARPTGTLPATTDIFIQNDAFSMLNPDNSTRFRVLWRQDETLTGTRYVGQDALDTSKDNSVKQIDKFLDLRNREAVYGTDGTGGIGDVDKGALYLVALGIDEDHMPRLMVEYRLRWRQGA